ncbi:MULTISPECIES: hypothetical protein [Halomicrobium]|uniref:Uncharacterized protein n=2 Tax=Halomicrobium mukohataei TaxID=57705 RepID=C7P459_HALMD|nr:MULTISPECIES: hypothetical protein [Halomicrobium]ACV47881.1 conserved hypothetical protein [Halomicrobium mukohataei DSM 12286]QCD66321.1 hypothetical protein E5139_11955 [Halomicrobium mukohataei]QFR21127.1 hypothetical protein GBQ70_11955 [Halomicrobium sp. ZPS1]
MLLTIGGFGTIPALLVGLAALAVVILIGRIVLKFAWRLVVLAAVAVGVLYLLGLFGISVL